MKKVLIILFALLICASLVACGNDIPVSQTYDTDYKETQEQKESKAATDEPFEMELVGRSSDGSFDYYRDIVTDVLYVRYREKIMDAGMGGLTMMSDPETGLPLTYTRYMEIYNGY